MKKQFSLYTTHIAAIKIHTPAQKMMSFD